MVALTFPMIAAPIQLLQQLACTSDRTGTDALGHERPRNHRAKYYTHTQRRCKIVLDIFVNVHYKQNRATRMSGRLAASPPHRRHAAKNRSNRRRFFDVEGHTSMKILNSGSGFPRPLYGQRFYSNPTLSAWLAGKPLPAKPAKPVELSPEALRMPWLSDKHLEHLLDKEDLSTGGRYLSLTARLQRFFAIRTGTNLHPVYRTVKRGAVVYFENDGPWGDWRQRAQLIWANMLPNDSDIFARPAHSESPKHKHLAEAMKPLLAWRNMSTPIRGGGTNWMQPDNDSYEDAEARPAIYPERRLRLTDKQIGRAHV